jgi:predicted enzyme related to lactoylglutathione lyase
MGALVKSDTKTNAEAEGVHDRNKEKDGIGGSEKGDVAKENGNRATGIVIFLIVEDVVATLEKVKGIGGKVIQEMMNEGGHTELGKFEDTEGNLVGVLRWLF